MLCWLPWHGQIGMAARRLAALNTRIACKEGAGIDSSSVLGRAKDGGTGWVTNVGCSGEVGAHSSAGEVAGSCSAAEDGADQVHQ